VWRQQSKETRKKRCGRCAYFYDKTIWTEMLPVIAIGKNLMYTETLAANRRLTLHTHLMLHWRNIWQMYTETLAANKRGTNKSTYNTLFSKQKLGPENKHNLWASQKRLRCLSVS
jgi:hypothetical protein